ncbi:four-carbon acid sugar kinase family protein [Isoptericola sp. NPDC056618]|uniref:four-carbon acid sugar kinase family protein n=1 Tax=Isoptericola sp. NPDC056618 TaxID=3345878 RepID=UPI0036B0A004
MRRALGVVADDLTGATDLAEQVWRTGRSATVLVGVPDDEARDEGLFADGRDCVVVALKNRTTAPADAAREAAQAARALVAGGAGLLYQKYCSTFDSTPAGNVGPIGDAIALVVAESVQGPVRSVGTPATPSVGRKVRDGRLYVHDELLEHTSMADHPRTPMRDSRLVELLRPQTPRPVVAVTTESLQRGPEAVADALGAAPQDGYVLCDARDDADLDVLAAALEAIVAGDAPIALHGGAGLAAAWARRGSAPRRPSGTGVAVTGRRLVLSGSLSAATRAQHHAFSGPRVVIDPTADVGAEVDRVQDELQPAYAGGDGPVLVTSWDGRPPGPVDEADADRAEAVLAAVAARAVAELGVREVLVAGGETSGAVVQALGVRELNLARSVGPGLVWCDARRDGAAVALLLKSGNFGGPTLFDDAWEASA